MKRLSKRCSNRSNLKNKLGISGVKGEVLVKPQSKRVLLIHGLSRTSLSMAGLARSLQKEGFTPILFDYPSTQFPIKTLTQKKLAPLLFSLLKKGPLNIVTHSLGGILLRCFCHLNGPQSNINRVVMLGPPNQGSEVAQFWIGNPLAYFFMGNTYRELGTGKESLPLSLGPVPFECGIISGILKLDQFNRFIFNDPNDGRVTVKRSRVSGMKAQWVFKTAHPFYMLHPIVKKQIAHFLKTGTFKKRKVENTLQLPSPTFVKTSL